MQQGAQGAPNAGPMPGAEQTANASSNKEENIEDAEVEILDDEKKD